MLMSSTGFFVFYRKEILFQPGITLYLESILVLALLGFFFKIVFGFFEVLARHVLSRMLGVKDNESGLLDDGCYTTRIFKRASTSFR